MTGGRRLALLLAATVAAATCGEPPRSTRLTRPPPPTPLVLAGGESLFVARCQSCHGQYALGSAHGPPLVHNIYAASHHADAAFLLAVRNGVRAHHWTFGNMPALPGLSENDILLITAWVRWLQGVSGVL